MKYENLGKIDNSHLAKADQSKNLAKDPECVKLSQYHSDAVDFAKTGVSPDVESKLLTRVWPDFMERKDKEIHYES